MGLAPTLEIVSWCLIESDANAESGVLFVCSWVLLTAGSWVKVFYTIGGSILIDIPWEHIRAIFDMQVLYHTIGTKWEQMLLERYSESDSAMEEFMLYKGNWLKRRILNLIN